MLRVALYTRVSFENLRDASIEDQLRQWPASRSRAPKQVTYRC